MVGSNARFAWLTVVTLLVTLLAGCTGGGDDLADPGVDGPEYDGDTGAVQGRVLDEEGVPVAGAQVGLVGAATFETATDEAGAFAFADVPPGRYVVSVLRLGYESTAQAVDVLADDVADVEILLTQIYIPEPYVDTFGPYAGYFECKMSGYSGTNRWTGNCGSVCVVTCVWQDSLGNNEVNRFEFETTSDDYRTVVGDMRWTPSAYGTSTELRMSFSYDERTSGHWFCSGEGPSPLQWRLEYVEDEDEPECHGASQQLPDDEPPHPTTEDLLIVYGGVPFARIGTGNPTGEPTFITFQQHFEMAVTVFYGEPGPTGYTGFLDA